MAYRVIKIAFPVICIVALILPGFCFAQDIIQPGISEKIGEWLSSLWQETLKICQNIVDWAKNIWDSYIYPWFQDICQKTEERKPVIEQEFEKEKEEMKKDIPGVSKSLWDQLSQKFKEITK